MSDYKIKVLKRSEVLRQKQEAGKEKTAAKSRGEIMDFYLNQREREGKPWFDIDRLLANVQARRTEKAASSAEERDEAEEATSGEQEKSAFWRGFERRRRDAF